MPKILSEFTVLPEYRDRLGDALAKFELQKRLGNARGRALTDLDEAVQANLPGGVLEELGRIVRKESEYALLIHGLPERSAPPYYVNEIATSLLRIHKCKPAMISNRTRQTTDVDISKIDGFGVHRDFMNAPLAGFASPFNAEHAPTEIISLEHALNAMSPAARRQKRVTIESQWLQSDGVIEPVYGTVTAQDLLERLGKNAQAQGRFVTGILSQHGVDCALSDAIARTSTKVDLQPGDLLFVDEHVHFHRAHLGDKGLVPPDTQTSRVLMRMAASRPAQRPGV